MKARWILFALALPACGLQEVWKQQCEQLGRAIERPAKYDANVRQCFIRCDYGWEYAENGCGGNRKR